MPDRKAQRKEKTSNGANLGFEQKLWAAADKLRGHMDPGEYKHVALMMPWLRLKKKILRSKAFFPKIMQDLLWINSGSANLWT